MNDIPNILLIALEELEDDYYHLIIDGALETFPTLSGRKEMPIFDRVAWDWADTNARDPGMLSEVRLALKMGDKVRAGEILLNSLIEMLQGESHMAVSAKKNLD